MYLCAKLGSKWPVTESAPPKTLHKTKRTKNNQIKLCCSTTQQKTTRNKQNGSGKAFYAQT
jgi:hypothetical protein